MLLHRQPTQWISSGFEHTSKHSMIILRPIKSDRPENTACAINDPMRAAVVRSLSPGYCPKNRYSSKISWIMYSAVSMSDPAAISRSCCTSSFTPTSPFLHSASPFTTWIYGMYHGTGYEPQVRGCIFSRCDKSSFSVAGMTDSRLAHTQLEAEIGQ